MKSKGYVRSERTELNLVKGYTLYKADGSNQFVRFERLVVLHLANKV